MFLKSRWVLVLVVPQKARSKAILLWVVCFATTHTLPVSAHTFVVSSNGTSTPSIQDAINAGNPGDTVLVGPGTYHENLDFLGKDMYVGSLEGPEATIIDGGQVGSCVKFIRGESQNATLEGFTLTNGTGSPTPLQSSRYGGGILIFNSEPRIVRNIITQNIVRIDGSRQSGYGGGIWCVGTQAASWSPIIAENIVKENHAGSIGGGLGAVNNMSPEVTDNVFIGNTVDVGDGAGIYMILDRDGTIIKGNMFHMNTAADHGGAIYMASNDPSRMLEVSISYNLIWENIALGNGATGDSGGGLWLLDIEGRIHHNTIVGNEGHGGRGDWGGGVACLGGIVTLENNIIAYTKYGGSLLCKENAQLVIRSNIFWDNGLQERQCCDSSFFTNNLKTDPQFCNPSVGDFAVAHSSPAIRAIEDQAGAFGAECEARPRAVSVTWGQVKTMFRLGCKGS